MSETDDRIRRFSAILLVPWALRARRRRAYSAGTSDCGVCRLFLFCVSFFIGRISYELVLDPSSADVSARSAYLSIDPAKRL
jgi:hypothetical protein